MRTGNKSYNRWVVVYLHILLVVEEIKWIEFSICWWWHIVTSNGFMDWQKFPNSKRPIRIRQPETLDSIKCPTFPGMAGSTSDISFARFNCSIFFCANGFNWDRPTEIVLLCFKIASNQILWLVSVRAWVAARQSDYAYFRVTRKPQGRRLFLSAATSPPPRGVRRRGP